MVSRALAFLGLLWLVNCYSQVPFALDPSFETNIQEHRVSSLAILPDGDLLLSGLFNLGGNDRNLYRVHADGTGYAGFPYAYGGGKLTAWQDRFYVANGQAVRRVWSDGIWDSAFIGMNTGPYFSSGLGGDYFVYPDGRILMSGSHDLNDTIRGYDGSYNLIWFSNQGYLDTTAHHRACDGHIEYIHPLPDGKFLLGGFWNEYDGIPVPNSAHLIRVFADGALDSTFQCPISWGAAAAHLLLPDEKHLIAGLFRIQGDADTLQLVRLQPNGAVDSTYNFHLQFLKSWDTDPPHTGINDLQPFGADRLIVTGGFDQVDGGSRGGIAMLDTSGQLVDDHFVGTACGIWNDGFQDFAYLSGIIPAPDGSFYIHGSYHGYNDGTNDYPGQRMVSRLYGLDVSVAERREGSPVRAFPNPASDKFYLEGLGADAVKLTLFDGLGQKVGAWPTSTGNAGFDLGGLMPGLYTLRIAEPGRAFVFIKLILQ